MKRFAFSAAGLAGAAFALSLVLGAPAIAQDAGVRSAQDTAEQSRTCRKGFRYSSRLGRCVRVRRGSY